MADSAGDQAAGQVTGQASVDVRLRWPVPGAPAPVLDPSQQAVADAVRDAGTARLLVLAGPGTGKTTTLVESVVARVEAGTDPSRILVLTFSRKAAQELRARLTARLDRTLAAPLAWTFHGYCYHVLTALRAADGADQGDGAGGAGVADGGALRLLAGPEQDVAVRELVEGALADGRSPWPAELAPALRTRGFADELRTLLARARSLGMEPGDLAGASGRADWQAAARFFDEYLDVLDARGVVDYAEVVLRAARLLDSAPLPPGHDSRYDVVLVDEYQDTDPAQEALLRALVPAGSRAGLVVVGDPDQSIYAFRGADVGNITEFPTRFPRPDGAPADVLALGVCRRSGGALLAASRNVIARSGELTRAVPADVSRRHRALTAAPGLPEGVVDVFTFGHEAAEAQTVADLLRREHLEQGTAWSDMAVVVRSATRSLPRLRRALGAAGVPVEVAADELPLTHEQAPRVLVEALECAVDLARDEPEGRLTEEAARSLLASPLGGADAAALRRLGRALRVEAADADEPVPSSAAALRACLLDPRLLAGIDERLARPALRVSGLLRAAADLVRADAGAYEVLWSLWAGTPWPRRLEATARRGGPEGRVADHDLDAVLALFDLATQHDTRPGRGLANFTDVVVAQQVPGETLAEKGVRPGGVRLLTAHRSKGLEWDVVVVAGVEEDVWPDVRRRGSLLQSDRLAGDGEVPAASAAELLAEERRLFYVACTRARRRLVVTAVDSVLDDGPRASRFLDDLGVEPTRVHRLPRRPLSLRGLVADLRRVAVDPASPPALREAAVARLGALTAARHDSRPLVPAADPAHWWGLDDVTAAEVPLAPPGSPVRMSGSSLRGLDECPARWALDHELRASGPRRASVGFGSVVHALADAVVRGTLPPDTDAVMTRLDEVWGRLDFEAPWQRDLEHEAARDALRRFLVWHGQQLSEGRRPVATEERFDFELEVDLRRDGAHAEAGSGSVAESELRTVAVRGAVDRLDLDADGRVVIVDYKTGKNHPSGPAVEVDPQLATYQAAVEAGAFDHVLGVPGADAARPEAARPEVARAELVQLRTTVVSGSAKVQKQSPLRSPSVRRSERDPDHDGAQWFDELVVDAVRRVAHEEFPAVTGPACQWCDFKSGCPTQDEGRAVIS